MTTNNPYFASPHAHDSSSVPVVMFTVCVALTPATLMGFYNFGWPAIFLWLITCFSAVATEWFCLWIKGASGSALRDNSALLTGWLLAMTLPPYAPWWLGMLGASFAIAVGKHVYGGIGQNLFNPAMLARVALLVSFPVQMTTWANPMPLFSEQGASFLTSLQITLGFMAPADGMTGATILGQIKASGDVAVNTLLATEWFFNQAVTGLTRGSLGETSEILVLLGGLFLLYRGIISWHIPATMLATVFVLALIFYWLDPAHYAGPLVHLTSGGIMLGAFFIATDYVTSPSTTIGKIWFGVGCGALTFAIRTWGGFPEGVGFAVLIMNALTPLLDRNLKPRAYGRNRMGEPLPASVKSRRVS